MLVALALVMTPDIAAAAASDWAIVLCPRREGKIDPTATVDKNLLASAVLDEAKVPRRFEAGVIVPQGLRMTRWQTMVARNRSLCGRDLDCGKDGAEALGRSSRLLQTIFEDTTNFVVEAADRRAMAFFADERSVLRCRITTETQTTDSGNGGGSAGSTNGSASDEGASSFAWSNFRIRGGADDLVFPRGTSGFADADKAAISLGNDDGKNLTKLIGSFGYALTLADGFQGSTHRYITAIPYFAANLDWSRKKGEARDVSNNLVDFGVVLEESSSVTRVSPDTDGTMPPAINHFEHYFAAIPRLIINYKDNSQVAGFDLLYRPSYVRGLNSLVQIGGSDFWWSTILDLRFNNGFFTRGGDREAKDSRDFSRIGGRVGLSLVSGVKGMPADLAIYNTRIWGLAGSPKHLSQLKANLAFYLNEERYFGIDLGYVRGRIADLEPRESKWTLGLALKY